MRIRTRARAFVAAMEDINPECILPICKGVGDQHIGTLKALMVLEDQIVLQVGFAKVPHQAACLNIDIECVPHRFVHVTKTNDLVCNSCWRTAAETKRYANSYSAR